MIDLRDMELLVALARQKHFARAAADCGISQPAFSMRLSNLERDLGVSIVARGNRFEGFTEEGEIVLRWARRMLDDARAMGQEISTVKGSVAGGLNIGVVPTALAYAAQLPVQMRGAYPDVVVRVYSATSLQIQQGIEDGSYDAGLTYAEGVPASLMHITPLYDEHYVLVVADALAPSPGGSSEVLSWVEASEVPLSLLVPQMQNRRIIDDMFAQSGQEPHVISEANAFTICLAMVREGLAGTILPDSLAQAQEFGADIRVLPLEPAHKAQTIALIRAKRAHDIATVRALMRVLEV